MRDIMYVAGLVCSATGLALSLWLVYDEYRKGKKK